MDQVLHRKADTGALAPGILALRCAAYKEPTFIFFPHAGGSPLSIGALAAALPRAVGVAAVHLAGADDAVPNLRPRRVDAAAGLFVQGLLSLIARDDFDQPQRIVLVGNSYGALLAYEAAGLLTRAGVCIERLVVSGFRSPAMAPTEAPLHRLAPRQLRAELSARFGAATMPIVQGQDQVEAQQALRADLEACDTYRHIRNEPLTVPIDVLHLIDDPSVSAPELSAWSALTRAPTSIWPLAAGHFPWATHPDAVARLLLELTGRHSGSGHAFAQSETRAIQQQRGNT